MVFAGFSRLFAVSVLFASTAAMAQTAPVQSCDFFRKAVNGDLCARTISIQIGSSYNMERFKLKETLPFLDYTLNKSEARLTSATIQWTPTDRVSLNVNIGYGHRRGQLVNISHFFSSFSQRNLIDKLSQHVQGGVSARLRLASVDFANGEHSAFGIAGVTSHGSSRIVRYAYERPTFGPVRRSRTITTSPSAIEFTYGGETSHRWALGTSGLSMSLLNQAVFATVSPGRVTLFQARTRALLAHDVLGIAIGPELAFSSELPDPRDRKPYKAAGGAIIVQPFRHATGSFFESLVLSASALRLINERIDDPTTWTTTGPGGTQVFREQPIRNRVSISASAQMGWKY